MNGDRSQSTSEIGDFIEVKIFQSMSERKHSSEGDNIFRLCVSCADHFKVEGLYGCVQGTSFMRSSLKEQIFGAN